MCANRVSKNKLAHPMKIYSNSGVTGTLYLDIRRAKKDNVYPVKYKVTFQRARVYYSTGINLSVEDFANIEKSKKKSTIKTFEQLLSFKDRIEEHLDALIKVGAFTFEDLNKRLGRGADNNILTFFNNKVQNLIDSGQIGTSVWYKYSANSIKLYTSNPLKFSDITVDWLKKFESWLLLEDEKQEKKAKSYTTISMYMRALQSIVNIGKEQGYITEAQYPFGKGKYEIPTGEGRNLALTLSQIGQLMRYEVKTENEARCRDLWFFSYLCNGINMVSLLKLKFSDISNGEISFYRQKTIRKTKNKKKISAPLLPQMEQIIIKWGNQNNSSNNFIFPFLKDGLSPIDEKRIVQNVTHLVNDKMQLIAKNLNLPKISTYTARHSFATVLKRSGANIAFISESLGHTNLDTTENYLASFEQDERLKNATLLTNF